VIAVIVQCGIKVAGIPRFRDPIGIRVIQISAWRVSDNLCYCTKNVKLQVSLREYALYYETNVSLQVLR
jgi:hypothetical protein